tara:strand:- start:345 stop:533 length:189 start_codon:yes stop_codon:yes gene_type:complete
MARKDKNKRSPDNRQNSYEDFQDIGKSMRKASKNRRKKDKKYLSDVMRGDIDIDDYHDYNDK